MDDTITHGGYIVTDNEAIHGTGATADEAWADMMAKMRDDQIEVLEDIHDLTEQTGSWTLANNFRIRSATAALIQDVQDKGGHVGWEMIGGVACTLDEFA